MNIPIHPKNKKVSPGQLITLHKKGREYYINNFNSLPKDVVIVKINRMDVFAYKDNVFDVIFNKEKTVTVHEFYDQYIELGEKKYHKQSPLVVPAKDTGNFILKEKAYRSYGGYYENNDDLIYSRSNDYWIYKDYAVMTEDTKTHEHRDSVYKGSSNKYYKYREMAVSQGRWGHAPYTKEAVFPEEINERRIGLEYEFCDSFDMFTNFLAGDYKYYFNSVRDGSLDGYDQGIEFVSVPIKPEELKIGTDFLDFAKKEGCRLTNACGYHVHVGASDFSFLDISRLVTLALAVEKQVFKLGGKDRQNNTYCKSLTERFYGFQDIVLPKEKNKVGRDLYKNMNSTFEDRHKRSKYVDAGGHRGVRYYWFNIDRFFYKREKPQEKTVEFRNHEATWDKERFHNFSLICYYMVEYAKNHSKKTCQNATLFDVANTSKIKHRKQLIKYLNKYL